MTKQQQTDLKNWKQDQSQPLPKSLENVLITRFIQELKENPEIRLNINKLGLIHIDEYDVITSDFHIRPNNDLHFFLSFLSRTPDGQVVIPFLDVQTIEYTKLKDFMDVEKDDKSWVEYMFYTWHRERLENIPKTLDHLLHQKFTESLRIGKTFEEACQIINLTYLQNI